MEWATLLKAEQEHAAAEASQPLEGFGEQPRPCCCPLLPPLVSTFIKVGEGKGRK